ncbi:UNVERIFIED_CONTAM: hypothetical protein Slati_0500100 [Sesamum latifolium]|uniref:MULE transposase domain-containing protein n=1 Tax=Sesamum latifolium TaxID=2727402 RepID=A0AAW2XZN8_9LAMI
MKDESSFQVRQYHFKHNCGPIYNCKNVNSTWLSKRFEQEFRTDPKRNIKGFKSDVVTDIRCHVSQSQAYRAKWKALKKIEGNPDDQYKQLWDYAGELQKTNPESTIIMSTTEGRQENERKFDRLIPAVEAVMPTIEHRFCVRHLHNNFKTAGFRGQALKFALWKAAKATTVQDFTRRMVEMGALDEKAAAWFHDKSPTHWSRSHFSTHPKSDMLLRDETDPPVEDRVETAEDIYSELLQSECLDDVMIDAPDFAVEYGENEPSTNAPKKLQVKKKRKTTSATPTQETCIGEDPSPRMLKIRSQTRLVSELPPRGLAPAAIFVPTPTLPPRPTLSPFVPPRTTPPQSLPPPPFVPPRTAPPQSMPPSPLPAPTSQAAAPQKGVNIRASPHISHGMYLQPKINKDQIENHHLLSS